MKINEDDTVTRLVFCLSKIKPNERNFTCPINSSSSAIPSVNWHATRCVFHTDMRITLIIAHSQIFRYLSSFADIQKWNGIRLKLISYNEIKTLN